jgi:hypothetical protein
MFFLSSPRHKNEAKKHKENQEHGNALTFLNPLLGNNSEMEFHL